MVTPVGEPPAIHLETPNYILRTIEPDDNRGSWSDWLTDPQTARALNARPVRLSDGAFRDYVQSFDGVTRHLLGIFEKAGGRLVGVRALYIDRQRNDFLVNVIIGDKQARNKGARAETGEAMDRYFFETLGLTAARCTVVSGNDIIMRVMDREGWVLEHKESKPSASGEGLVELLHFRLTRDEWRRRHLGV